MLLLFNETRAREAAERKRLLQSYSAFTSQVNAAIGIERQPKLLESMVLVKVERQAVSNSLEMLLKIVESASFS